MDQRTAVRVAGSSRSRTVTAGLLAALTATLVLAFTPGAGAADAPHLIDASTIVSGYTHSCAIRKSDPGDAAGQAVCWGLNNYGQLGDGTMTDRSSPVAVKQPGWTGTPPNDGRLDDVIQVTAGDGHTCAIRRGGQVVCWGANPYLQIGQDSSVSRSTIPMPVKQAGWTGTAPDDGPLENVVQLAGGNRHTCARQTGGSVVCWGANSVGQLGNGATTNSFIPVAVKQTGWTGIPPNDHSLGDAIRITAARGGLHTCAVRTSGQVACWGNNVNGQLGDGTFTDRTSPVAVKQVGWTAGSPGDGLLTDASQIAAGAFHSCAVGQDGGVTCWGSNQKGQLGTGASTGSAVPVPVRQTGWTGTPPDDKLFHDATGITAGREFSCATGEDRTVSCWGLNEYGQLGDGTTTPRAVPVAVKPVGWSEATPTDQRLGPVATVAAGDSHVCALMVSSPAVCWGSDSNGQLANGNIGDDFSASVPGKVLRGETVPGIRHRLGTEMRGAGRGSLASIPAGIDCGTSCEGTFAEDAVLKLTATAAEGSIFKGWSGDCSGAGPTCSVAMTEDRQVIATFAPASVPQPNGDTAIFDGKALHIRLKCGAKYRPSCSMVATAVTGKGSKGQPMSKSLKRKIKAGRWAAVTLPVKPGFRSKLTAMSRRKGKTLTVRQKISSKWIGKKLFRKVMKGKKRKTVYHRYKVRSAIP